MSATILPFEMSHAMLDAYFEGISFATISRNPRSPIRFASLKPGRRVNLIINEDEVQKRAEKVTITARFSWWCLWTMDGLEGTAGPEPHITGLRDGHGIRPHLTTSEVVALAEDMSCAFTVSGSLYSLSRDERPVLSSEAFRHLVGVLNAWGYQDELMLPSNLTVLKWANP